MLKAQPGRRMKLARRKTIAFATLLLAFSCLVSFIIFGPHSLSMKDTEQIKTGMSYAQVEHILGNPVLGGPPFVAGRTLQACCWYTSDGEVWFYFDDDGKVKTRTFNLQDDWTAIYRRLLSIAGL
ncbi:MAG: outer membrane protein assembly factor BamE [Gemmataceae bacterium]